MEKLNIPPTIRTPEIDFDPDQNRFVITGKSLPEDVRKFYKPAFELLEKYVQQPNDITEVTFKMVYMNSASAKIYHDLLSILNKVHESGKKVVINWQYSADDESILETGEDLNELFDFEFKMEPF